MRYIPSHKQEHLSLTLISYQKTNFCQMNMDLAVIHSLLSNKQLHKRKLKLTNELVSLLDSLVDGIIVASCKDEICLPCMHISSL